MNLWHDLEKGENFPQEMNVIIEIPKGSKNKYEIDKKTGLFKLDRAMKTSQDYPFDYGFAPQTLWEDGDALDVIVLSTFPFVLLESKPNYQKYHTSVTKAAEYYYKFPPKLPNLILFLVSKNENLMMINLFPHNDHHLI